MKNTINNTSTIFKSVLLLSLIVVSLNVNAISPGKYTKYQQVTDKEVLIESTKGVKILFTAYDNNSIGISYFNKDEEVKLISPSSILNHKELSGSIYVEEIDELMQITTTSKDGLMIKVDKRKFDFTFIDKSDNSEIDLEEELLAGIVSKKLHVSYQNL
jgi:hypothetical protein